MRDDGDTGAFETPMPPYSELAGFESWRWTVWGSAPVRRLGLTILPSLADGDVYASGVRLDELEAEVRQLERVLRAVVDELEASGVHIVANADPYETVRERLANIAAAIRLARALPGGEVVIW